MPVLITRTDYNRIVQILLIVSKGGCGGIAPDLVADARHYADLLETQLKHQ